MDRIQFLLAKAQFDCFLYPITAGLQVRTVLRFWPLMQGVRAESQPSKTNYFWLQDAVLATDTFDHKLKNQRFKELVGQFVRVECLKELSLWMYLELDVSSKGERFQ